MGGSANVKGSHRQIAMLGIDPGLGHTGYAVASIDIATRQIAKVIRVGLLQTDRQKLKQVRQTSDNLRRARQHVSGLKSIIDQHGIKLVAMEMGGASQYAYPNFSSGVMVGVAASLDPPIIEVLPHEVKFAATGRKLATKAEIVAWAVRVTGRCNVGWPISGRSNSFAVRVRGENVAKVAEHPADALAAIQAALATEQFTMSVRLLQ